MEGIELYDDDLNFQKKYIIYTIDDDIVASSYDLIGERCVLNNDLTTQEYDMLDEYLNRKLGEA